MPVKICHIITNLDHGGAQEMLAKLLRHSRGHECEVVSLKDGGVHGAELARIGVRVMTLGMTGIASGARAFGRLRELLRESRPDLVQTWLYHADCLGGLAAQREGVRHILWNVRTGGRLSLSTLKPATYALMKGCAWMSRQIPERIVVNSKQALEEHVRRGYARERFEMIPNGFDVGRFRPDESARGWLRTELGIPRDRFLVGLVARFHEQKDHRLFLAAATKLSDADFVLVGPGVEPANRELVSWMGDGVRARCHLLGRRDDVPRITAGLDIACCTSAFGESFPNVIGEAMACGVPCVATDVGDSAWIVGDAGRVIPPGGERELLAAWKELRAMTPGDRRAMGERGRAWVTEHFSIDAVAAKYLGLYESLMEAKPCAA